MYANTEHFMEIPLIQQYDYFKSVELKKESRFFLIRIVYC